MASDQDLYHEPAYYGLSHPDPQFPHQYVADAVTADQAGPSTSGVCAGRAVPVHRKELYR
jgi:hypothetical protein